MPLKQKIGFVNQGNVDMYNYGHIIILYLLSFLDGIYLLCTCQVLFVNAFINFFFDFNYLQASYIKRVPKVMNGTNDGLF